MTPLSFRAKVVKSECWGNGFSVRQNLFGVNIADGPGVLAYLSLTMLLVIRPCNPSSERLSGHEHVGTESPPAINQPGGDTAECLRSGKFGAGLICNARPCRQPVAHHVCERLYAQFDEHEGFGDKVIATAEARPCAVFEIVQVCYENHGRCFIEG